MKTKHNLMALDTIGIISCIAGILACTVAAAGEWQWHLLIAFSFQLVACWLIIDTVRDNSDRRYQLQDHTMMRVDAAELTHLRSIAQDSNAIAECCAPDYTSKNRTMVYTCDVEKLRDSIARLNKRKEQIERGEM